MHGDLGPFDIDLPLTGTRGIECRSGGPTGDYAIVFTFTNPLTAVDSVSPGCGSVNSSMIDGSDAHRYIVNLTGVACNEQYVTTTLTGVHDNQVNTLASAAATMGLLIGDSTADGRVDSGDVSLVRQQTLQTITASNFREDINASGRIDAGDVSIARQQALTSLPTPP